MSIMQSSFPQAGAIAQQPSTKNKKQITVASNNATRKSGILEPTMLLTGHQGEIFGLEFSPEGKYIASGGFDRTILIYNVYGECENWCVLKGHNNAILELHWSPDSTQIYSCSADMTLALWDVESGSRIKKFTGHHALINSCQCSRKGTPLAVTGSDDNTTKIWDIRTKRYVKSFEAEYQVLAVTIDDNNNRVFSGSLDNTIKVYDMRKEIILDTLTGHTNSITGIDLSRDGSRLISNGMDQIIRIWDVQPFFRGNSRCTNVLAGATHNFEKNLLRVRWNMDDTQIAAGSADRYAYIWCAKTSRLLYRLPGHTGSVSEVVFHPSEPIIASASSDKTIFMGELN